MEENNDKKQLERGISTAIGIYFLSLVALTVIAMMNNRVNSEVIAIIVDRCYSFVQMGYFILGIILYFAYRDKDRYFAKGFLIGSFIPITVIGVIWGSCAILFGGNL